MHTFGINVNLIAFRNIERSSLLGEYGYGNSGNYDLTVPRRPKLAKYWTRHGYSDPSLSLLPYAIICLLVRIHANKVLDYFSMHMTGGLRCGTKSRIQYRRMNERQWFKATNTIRLRKKVQNFLQSHSTQRNHGSC